jgi:hypothetical protein
MDNQDIISKMLKNNDFKKFLEMTMSYKQMQEYPFPDFSDAEHIGDIEHNKVIHKNM